MPKVKEIVTHIGPAHRDEFVAVGLLLAGLNPTLPVYRREPSQKDLDDPCVLVVDVGGSFDLEKGNLDHHQLSREHAPVCSITQVLHYLKIDLGLARNVWNWLVPSEQLDSKGPYEVAKAYGMPSEAVFAMQSPVEVAILNLFSKCSAALPGDFVHKAMFEVGESNLMYLENVQRRLARLSKEALFSEIGDVRILNTTSIPGDEQPSLGVEMFLKESPSKNETEVVVSRDDRGDGLTLFRRNNSPKIDFSKLEGKPGVVFAHKGGFIAKVTADADWRDMILDAYV